MTSSIRNELLGLDPFERERFPGYAAEVEALVQRRLGAIDKIRFLLPTVGGFTMAAVLSTLALTEPASTPAHTRGVLLTLAAGGAAWFFAGLRILRRGSLNLIGDRRTIARLALGLSLLQLAFFAIRLAVTGESGSAAIMALGFALVAALLHALEGRRASEIRRRVAALSAAHHPH